MRRSLVSIVAAILAAKGSLLADDRFGDPQTSGAVVQVFAIAVVLVGLVVGRLGLQSPAEPLVAATAEPGALTPVGQVSGVGE